MATQSRPPLILLTRPLAQSRRFADQICARFGPLPILMSPVMAIRALDAQAPAMNFTDLILTSQNGAEQLATVQFDPNHPAPTHAFCVGERTAVAARHLGLAATVLGGDAKGLIAAITAIRPKGPLLHLHGTVTRGDVAKTLTNGGIETVSQAIYDQTILPLTAQAWQVLAADAPVILPVFSPRAAKILSDLGPFDAPLFTVAISQAAANPMRGLNGTRLEIAQSPDADGMLDALAEILRHPRT